MSLKDTSKVLKFYYLIKNIRGDVYCPGAKRHVLTGKKGVGTAISNFQFRLFSRMDLPGFLRYLVHQCG